MCFVLLIYIFLSQLKGVMSYGADKLGFDAHTHAHTQTDASNDNTRRPKLASGKIAVICVENGSAPKTRRGATFTNLD